MSEDINALLGAASLPERKVPVCLRGDLQAEIDELERQLREQYQNPQTMADRGDRRRLAEQIETVREQMRSSIITFRLRGLNRRRYSDLLAAHPPRRDNDEDKALGYNSDSFWPALIRACLVEPNLSDEQWERLDDQLSSAQFDLLLNAAHNLCRRPVDVPFSSAASATLSSSGETSN